MTATKEIREKCGLSQEPRVPAVDPLCDQKILNLAAVMWGYAEAGKMYNNLGKSEFAALHDCICVNYNMRLLDRLFTLYRTKQSKPEPARTSTSNNFIVKAPNTTIVVNNYYTPVDDTISPPRSPLPDPPTSRRPGKVAPNGTDLARQVLDLLARNGVDTGRRGLEQVVARFVGSVTGGPPVRLAQKRSPGVTSESREANLAPVDEKDHFKTAQFL